MRNWSLFKLFLLLLAQFLMLQAAAQSPGGISTNLNLWLKANSGPQKAGPAPATNGDAITTWLDQSGLGRDYTAVAGPTLQGNTLNFNPSVEILSGGFDGPGTAALGTNWTVFFISQKLASDNNGRLFDGHTGNFLWAHWGNFTNSIYLNGTPANHNVGIATTTGIQNLHLHSFKRESAGGTLEARADGTSLTTFGTSNSASGTIIDINQGAFAAGESSHSRVGEMIIYNTSLNTTDVEKVESYLGIKYGLTLAHNYLASDGTIIWNSTANAAYHNNVAGIGRDNNGVSGSDLIQSKSKSINAGSDITMDNGGTFSNLNFIVWGDNNAANGTSPDAPTGYARRLNKIWKTTATGTPGAVDVTIDLTDLGLPIGLPATNYTLLIDNDATTLTDAVAAVPALTTRTGSQLTFSGITFTGTQFFTVAVSSTALKGPANVTENLKLWLKADIGVTGGGAITNWDDQSGNGYQATNPTVGSPKPAWDNVNLLNFNPVVDFTNSHLKVNGGIMGLSSYSNAWIYTVMKGDVNQQNTLFYESMAGTENFNVLLPWTGSVYYDFGNTGAGRVSGAWGGNLNSYNIWTLGSGATAAATPNGTNKVILRDGSVSLFNNSNDATIAGNNQPFFIGGGYNTGLGADGTQNQLDGKLAELIIYTGVPTELEQEKIQSYLAIKYGITKNSADAADVAVDGRNYFSSTGTIIWDYAANSIYNNNVAGIGLDTDIASGSGLSQMKSRSSNAGADVTMTGTIGTNLSYLIWGDNNAANGTSTQVPAPTYVKRLNKVWKTSLTNTPGLVSVSIDLTDLGLPVGLAAGDYALLIDADGDFSNATPHTTGAAIVGGQLSFTNVSLLHGGYFTVAVKSTALKGPANITENLKLWLKADAGLSVAGSTVTSWTDQAGNGYTATPPGTAPIRVLSQLNFNPVVDFTNGHLRINGGIMGSNLSTYTNSWIYAVMKGDVNQQNTLFYESMAGTENFNVLLPWSGSVYYDFGNTGAGRVSGAWGGNLNSYNIWTLGSGATAAATPNGTNKAISRDGLVFLSNNSNDATIAGNNQPFFIGGGYNTGLGADGTQNQLDGKVAELIIYTGLPTALEQEKIQSYLAIKYGITKNSTDITGTAGQDERNYFASDGTPVWDYIDPITTTGTYHNRVTGIGRDDASQLNQQMSLSISNGALLTLNKGTAFGSDLSFIVTGDDGGVLTSTNLSVAPYTKRTTRIWRADVTGTPGTINVSFDVSSGIHNSGNATDYALLIKHNSANFITPDVIHTTGASLVNNVLTFTGVPLADGDYFTIGIIVFTPAGLQTPVFWVKGGSGVTGTSDVSIWADQSGAANNAVQATVANQPSLTTVANYINFNPAIDFSTSTDIMTPLVPPANAGSTIFTVAVPTVNSNWRTMFRGSAGSGDHPLIVESGGIRLGYYDNDLGGFQPSGFTWLQNEAALVGLEMITDVNFRKNGSQGVSNNTIVLSGLSLNYFGNYQGGGQPFGRIAETIIYNTPLSLPEKEKIESYLGVKYGITLTHNYSATNNNVIWNVATDAAYSNRIAGIGRDDLTALDQRKSKSVGTGSVLTIEKTAPASAFGTDLSFLITGDDGGVLGATTTNVYPGYPMRVARIWKTTVTGNPGATVSVSFDLGSGIYNTGNAGNYAILLKSGNADFTTGATAHVLGASLVGSVLTFTDVPLANDTYFTLGLPRLNSPGGIVNNLRMWLKADVGVTPAGANASMWADQTGYYFSANQFTSVNQPTIIPNRLNFNPAIQFDGTNDQLVISGGIMGTATYNDINVFAVSRVNTITPSSIFYETQAAGGRINAHVPWNDNNVYWDAGSAAAPHRLNSAWGGNVNTGYIWSLLASTTSTAAGGLSLQNIFRNGTSVAADGTMGSFTGNGSNMTLGTNGSGNFFNGEISELITYTGSLSAAQYQRIQSYLAIKYGITLDQTVAVNYVASNGLIIWDATANATYKVNIAGIGRDDASALSQPKSASVNTNSIVTIDKGAAFGTDLDFLVWGSDNAYTSPTTVNKHPSYPYRLGKTWRVDVSGTPGLVSVSFDLSTGIYNTGNVANYALLIHNSSDFTSGTAHTTGAVFNGSTLTFTNVNFADGDYFTLGMPTPPAPGGIVNNMGIWLKANQGVTGGANASAWADLSGNNFNVLQNTGGNQPAVVNNRTNFNPSIQFDGTDDYLSLTGGILGTNTFTDIYAFIVSRTNVSTASYPFYENNSGGQFSLRAPWSDNTLYWEPGNTGTNRVSAPWGAITGTSFLWGLTASTSATPSGQRQDIFRNGFNLASDATMGAFTGNNSNFSVGSAGAGSYYNGEVSEMVIYKGALTATMMQQVQSYMALKYGITLVGQNYLSSAGTSIYNTTTSHAGYPRDIAGIGRDDNSALSQLKSQSINNPVDLVSIANNNFTTPAVFANSGEFLVWGNNGQPNLADPSAAGFTHAGTVVVRKLNKIWSTQKTGSPTGDAVVEVDMNLVVGPSGFGTNDKSAIRLLVDNDAVFGNSSGGEFTYSTAVISGEKMYFTVPYANINAGQGFFTIGSVNATTAPITTPTPGGVIGDMRLWLKANAGVSGAPITTWADQSVNAYSATTVPGNAPDYLANQFNNNPAIDFTRASGEYVRIASGIMGSNTYNDAWIYVVSQADLIADQTMFFESMTGGEFFSSLIPWSNSNIYFDFGNSGGAGRINGAWGGSLNTHNIWTLGSSTATSTPNGTRKSIARDGAIVLTNNNNDNTTGANQPFLIGGGFSNGSGTTNNFDGRIAELIVFAEVPTELEQEKIQSYLSIKYGISKNTTDIAGTVGQDERDYFASDGTIIWDYSANAPFNNKIAGIGKDDASALTQTKSQSNATLSIVSMEKVGAFGSNKDFLLWGHDNGFLSLTSSGAHASLPYRLGRVWKADLNGTPGVVTVGFDLSAGIYNNGNAADYRLLYGTSSSNFSAATAVVGTFVGNVLTFTGIPFNDGDFFTLGVANMPAPGGVVEGMQFWVKANAGVTGSPVSSWTDQSGNGFVLSQATAANQPASLSSDINYNPSVQFDGTNDQLVLTGGVMGTNTYTNFNSFMAARTNVVTNSSIFFENQNGGGSINVHLPYGTGVMYWDAGSTNANQRLNFNWGGTAGINYLWSLTASTTATPSGARQDIYRNGLRIANDATMTSFTGNNSNFSLGNGSGGFYNGALAENVFYTNTLTASQFQRIQSYFAVKYGITLNQTPAQSYYASDWNGTAGTLIWNATSAAAYKNDIAAIGRDDNSALNQKQSSTVNTNVLTISNGVGAVPASNAANASTFGADKTFFAWAHNNLIMDGEAVTDLPATIQTRLARVWQGQETGSVGTVRVKVNLSTVAGVGGVTGANDLNEVRLLVDADGVFATGATIVSPAPGGVDNTAKTVEFELNFTDGAISYFTIGSVNKAIAPLPIQLVSFTATPEEDQVTVAWKTLTEINNDFFTVESSIDGFEWGGVRDVKGAGNSTSLKTYEITDGTPFIGKSYYRLKQTDFDGKVSYSKAVEVIVNEGSVKVFPNPVFDGKVTIQIKENLGQQVQIKLLDSQQRELKSQTYERETLHQSVIVLDLPELLPSGIYYLKIIDKASVRYRRIVVY